MLTPRPTLLIRAAIIVLAVSTAATLGGCSAGPMDAVIDSMGQGSAEVVEDTADATFEATDPGDIVDLPSDFPDAVPLLDGAITSATGMSLSGLGYWDIHVRTPDAAAAMRLVRSELATAGFDEQKWSEVGAGVSGLWASDAYRVAVQSARDIDGEMLLYTVTELG